MLPGFLVINRGNRHGHSRDPSPFGHRSSPEASSLRRRYPASPVLQASPPPLPAQHRIKSGAGSDPRGLSVGACHATGQGFPCCVHSPSSMRAAAITPAEPVGACVARFPTGASLPPFSVADRLPHYTFRGLLSVYLTLRPVWSLSRPWRPVTSECFRRCRYLHHPLCRAFIIEITLSFS